jgi:hypothetical protein
MDAAEQGQLYSLRPIVYPSSPTTGARAGVAIRARAGRAAQDKALDTATFTYDFRETSSGTHRSVVKKVSKRDFDKAGQALDYTGAPRPGRPTDGAALLDGARRRRPPPLPGKGKGRGKRSRDRVG